MKRLVVTGGLGFIGAHVVRGLLRRYPRAQVINVDKATYAGRPENPLGARQRYRWLPWDIGDPRLLRVLRGCDALIHTAAESHVDRSIRAPAPFLRTNVVGTWRLFEMARRAEVPRVLHMSTDEVYGEVLRGLASEEFPLRPGNPYSASKGAADLLALAYHRTYGFPVLVERCTNNFGPRQHPEKMVPNFITRALQGRPLPVYGDGLQVRDWIHVEDHAEAVLLLLERGEPGEVYNASAGNRRRNLDVARAILRHLNRPPGLIEHVPDRPGHDRRYALSARRLRALGWRPRHGFRDRLAQTVEWYRTHETWWRPLVA